MTYFDFENVNKIDWWLYMIWKMNEMKLWTYDFMLQSIVNIIKGTNIKMDGNDPKSSTYVKYVKRYKGPKKAKKMHGLKLVKIRKHKKGHTLGIGPLGIKSDKKHMLDGVSGDREGGWIDHLQKLVFWKFEKRFKRLAKEHDPEWTFV